MESIPHDLKNKYEHVKDLVETPYALVSLVKTKDGE